MMAWDGANLELRASSNTRVIIPASEIIDVLRAALDAAVLNEDRVTGGDRFMRERDAIGGSPGDTWAPHSFATVTGRGIILIYVSGGEVYFDIGNVSAWAMAVANLCQEAIPDVAGQLMKA